MPNCPDNIYAAIPKLLPEEQFVTLLKQPYAHIERIVSKGHSTPTGQWYDQAWDEWVLVLQGQATIQYQQSGTSISMKTGDYLLIPAHTRHRVEWTDTEVNTVWLAIHLPQP